MLKSVHLRNFKLHEFTSIEAAPITVFIGPNNSGKSSIFQALLALKQAAARPHPQSNYFLETALRQSPSPGHPFLFEDNRLIDIGEFKDVVRQGLRHTHIDLSGTVSRPRPAKEIGPLGVDFHTEIQENVLVSHEGSIRFSQDKLEWRYPRVQSVSPQPEVCVENFVLRFNPVGSFKFIQFGGFVVSPQASPELAGRVTEKAQTLESSPVQLLMSLHPIFPLRGFEEWGFPSPQFPTTNLERLALTDRAVAIASTLASNYKLRKQVSERLQRLLNIGIEIETVGVDRVKIYATSDEKSGSVTLFSNEGTGANQLPFILVPVALTPNNETVLLSEPEAHLHPKGQCELTRMLLTIAKKENIQFFIETHSEHVLHTILNEVAKGEWGRDEVALHYFQNKNGTAEVSKREINQFGQVDGGLPDFFEQSLAELTDYLKAVSRA